jgi:AAA+ superfamily predicted ATPase
MLYNQFFEPVLTCPDTELQERLNHLVGLDEHKERLTKIISLLIDQEGFKKWVKKYHPKANDIISNLLRRPPLVILEGDVGSGKTELATTIGDAVARKHKIEISVFPLSLSTRGQGRVGEMTKLISDAFSYTINEAKKLRSTSEKSRGGIILLVDEADALTQSRENAQMHHEDKAGVNAFIRGVDRIGNNKLPVTVIMCTNRIGALDPAVKRRAADILMFNRPNEGQRKTVLSPQLKVLGFSEREINEIIIATGSCNGREYGFTFSDITQRLFPRIILDAYPDKEINPKRAITLIKSLSPTPPFKE